MKTKRIKTVFTLLLVLATALSCLTACGNSDKPQGDYSEPASAEGKNTTEPATTTEPTGTTTEPITEPTETNVEPNLAHPEFHRLTTVMDETAKSDYAYYRICTGEYTHFYEYKDYRYLNDNAPLFEDTVDTYCLTINPETKEEVLFKLLNDTEKGAEDLKLYGYIGCTYPELTQEEFEAKMHNGYVYGRPFRITDASGRYLDNAYALDDLVGLLADNKNVIEHEKLADCGANAVTLIFQKRPDTLNESEVHYYEVDDATMETIVTLMKRYWDNESVDKGGSPLADYTIEEVLTNAVYDCDDVSPVFTD